jgi:predicted small secreted protein
MKLNIFLIASALGMVITLAGCNTVKGTFEGMGKDLNSISHPNSTNTESNGSISNTSTKKTTYQTTTTS